MVAKGTSSVLMVESAVALFIAYVSVISEVAVTCVTFLSEFVESSVFTKNMFKI